MSDTPRFQHLLRPLGLPGADDVLRALPAFDFHLLHRCVKLVIDVDDAGTKVLLTATYRDVPEVLVTLRMAGVRNAILPAFAPDHWLTELGVEDVSKDQLEGLRYRVFDAYDPSLEVWCTSLTLSVARGG